jgi:hypothetical protein
MSLAFILMVLRKLRSTRFGYIRLYLPILRSYYYQVPAGLQLPYENLHAIRWISSLSQPCSSSRSPTLLKCVHRFFGPRKERIIVICPAYMNEPRIPVEHDIVNLRMQVHFQRWVGGCIG